MQKNYTMREFWPKAEKCYDLSVLIILYMCRHAPVCVVYTASCHTMSTTVVQQKYNNIYSVSVVNFYISVSFS